MNRWEFSKSRSNYHFDPTVNEDSVETAPFKILGNASGLIGRFNTEVEKTHPTPYSFGNRMQLLKGKEGKYFTSDYDKKELEDLNLPKDFSFFNWLNVTDVSLKEKIQKVFCFKDARFNAHYHVQMPGQMFPYHIDELPGFKENQIDHEYDKDPKWITRFEIMVYDWVPGHVWAYGNTYWKQWKSGDIAWHNWRDVPHGTANLSHTPRVVLQITGRCSEHTLNIIDSGNLTVNLG